MAQEQEFLKLQLRYETSVNTEQLINLATIVVDFPWQMCITYTSVVCVVSAVQEFNS